MAVHQINDRMRITISHNRPKQEVIQSVDRSFDDLFQGVGTLPVKLVVDQKNWEGSTLTFSLTAKLGFVSTPIKGTVEVTDQELIIDADLGILNHFVSETAARDLLTTRIRGLLT